MMAPTEIAGLAVTSFAPTHADAGPTARWPEGMTEDSAFVIPTMK